MSTTINKAKCPECHKGDVTIDKWNHGHQSILAYSPCSNQTCPSHLPLKETKEIEEAMAKLTPKERIAYSILDKVMDALIEAGVDVSYFPHKAQIVLINAAKDITTAIECADNAII